MAVQTVKQFLDQSYRLISANSPTVPLQGSDLQDGITVMNQLLSSFASTGLLLTIAKTVSFNLPIGQQNVTFGSPTDVPTPDFTLGRLANWDSAWLQLQGTIYPLIPMGRDQFLSYYKYDPLQGLPRFIITYPDTNIVSLRLYPSASQVYQFNIRGKFQFPDFTSTGDMSSLPIYYNKFFLLAVARDLALFKGRADAWTDKLEARYQEMLDKMEAASEVNMSIVGDRASMLNGANRVRAGV